MCGWGEGGHGSGAYQLQRTNILTPHGQTCLLVTPSSCFLICDRTMVAPRNTAYAEESAEVEVLYANLEKLNRLTKKIQGSMVRLETGGKVVKEAIGPIYSNTQSLQITNTNIDKVNDAIDRLRQPLDAKSREEGILRAG